MGTISTFTRPILPEVPTGQRALLTTSPVSTPAYAASQLSFSVISRIHIAAPASLVASVIIDGASWGEWNTFIPSISVTSKCTDVTYPPGLTGAANGENNKGSLRQGDRFTMFVNMPGAPLQSLNQGMIEKFQTTHEIVNLIEALDPAKEEGRKGYRICWKDDGGFGGLLRADRVQECVDLGDGTCEWVTFESFGGWLAPVVRLATGSKLVERFGDWGRDLKARCEKLKKEANVEEGMAA